MTFLPQWLRAIYRDNGTLVDRSIALQNDDSIPFEIVAAEDQLYIGQYMPFNNLYLEIATPNTNVSSVDVEYWTGSSNAFVGAVDILDGTSVNSISCAQSGVIQFEPDRDESNWSRTVETQDTSNGIPELNAVQIYNLYWMRLVFDADFSVGTTLRRIGYKFTTDEFLESIDPEINLYLNSWETGKTDWNEQILVASQLVIADMKRRGLISHPGMVLRFDDVALATAYRTLMLIYAKLGEAFVGPKQDAMRNFRELMDIKRFTIDKSQDAEANLGEVNNVTWQGVR